MLMEYECQKLAEYGKRMENENLTEGTAGNLSIYNPDSKTMAITPSGISYSNTTPDDIVVMDLNGNVLYGKRKPSSEHFLHAEIYKNLPLSRAIVHTHSTYCTVLSCLRKPIEAVHYVLADAKVSVVPVAEYATYGTRELAENVLRSLGRGRALLLSNHGFISWGETMDEAYSIAKTCEWTAKIQWKCMCAGSPTILSNEEMEHIINKFQTYGQTYSGRKV